MTVPQSSRRSGFSLRLEQGAGRLVLHERRVADTLDVERLHLSLLSVPARLDMSTGVERFRHHRTALDELVVSAEDQDLGRMLRARAADAPFVDLEVRALTGHLAIAGTLQGRPPVPFIARAALEPAAIATDRSILISVFDVRVLGPARWSGPEVAAALLRLLGLEESLHGPTAAVLDPVQRILLEVFAELGWKLPDRTEARIDTIDAEAGRLRLAAARRESGRQGPRAVVPGRSPEAAALYRRFLADYEAKSLYGALEGRVLDGAVEQAIAGYERQLEVHPDHPFVVRRLLQLMSARPESRSECVGLARTHLARYPDDPDALTALATAHQAAGEREVAVELWRRLADQSEARGDVLEAAQALLAVAVALDEAEPVGSVRALERALALRRRLPSALRGLAVLHERLGDWSAALRARERLLAQTADPEERRTLLHEIGALALERAGEPDAASGYFERLLEGRPDDVDALLGLAHAHVECGRTLPAVRALDRAARLMQDRGEAAGAAAILVQLGDLWRGLEDGGPQTAALRYRQALMLQPDHPGALLGLAEAAVGDGDPQRAREHLEAALRLPARESKLDRAALHLRLGGLIAGPLHDAAGAIPHYQKALDGAPETAAAALRALEDVYDEAERWDDLARVLEVRVQRAPDDPARAAAMARLAHVIGERLGAAGRARGLLETAARLQPGESGILAQLVELLRAQDDPTGLVDALERWARGMDVPADEARAHAERGDLLRLRLNRVDDAAAAYARALGCDPNLPGALEGLADIYRERERFAELVPILRRQAEGDPDPFGAARRWAELGHLEARILERPPAGIVHLERAVELDPGDTRSLRLLGDLHFEGGHPGRALARYRALRALYEAEGYDEPPAPFLVRFGDALAGAGRADEAVDVLAAARGHDPDRREVYERAQDLLLQGGDTDGIVAFMRAGLELAKRPETRVFLARRAGRLLWRELRRPEDAAEVLAAAGVEDDDLVGIRLEVATALNDWPTVASLLRARLSRAVGGERPEILTRLARLAFGALERPDEGMRLAVAALEEQPDYVPALTLLGEQAFESADWVHAREAYSVLVDLEGDDARPEDRFRLAVSELYAGDAGAARERMEALHAAGHPLPLLAENLAEACLRLDDPEGLARVLESRLMAFESTPGGRDSFLRRAGALFEAAPAYEALALRCWQALLATDPEDAEARAAIARLAPEPEPQPAVDVEPESAQAPPDAPESEPEAAVDPEPEPAAAAEPEPEPAAAADPEPEPAAAADPEPEPAAAADPEPVPAAAADPEQEPAAAAEPEPSSPGDDAERPGEADAEGAIEAEAGAAIEPEPPSESVPGQDPDPDGPDPAPPEAPIVDEVDVLRAEAEATVESLRARAAEATEPMEAAVAWSEAADVLRDRLGRPVEAIEALEAVRASAGRAWDAEAEGAEHLWREAVDALEDLYGLDERWDALLELYRDRGVRGVGEPAELALLEAAAMRAAGRLADAAERARDALEDAPERARELIVTTLEEAGRYDEAAALLLEASRETADPEESGWLQVRAAERLALRAPERALVEYAGAAVRIDDPTVTEDWLLLARRVDDATQLAAALERAAALVPDGAGARVRASRLLHEAGELVWARLDDKPRAAGLLRAAVDAWPENVEALERLTAALDTLDDAAGLREALEAQRALMLPGAERGRIGLRLARLVHQRLGDPEAARALVEAALPDLEGTGQLFAAEAFLTELSERLEGQSTGGSLDEAHLDSLPSMGKDVGPAIVAALAAGEDGDPGASTEVVFAQLAGEAGPFDESPDSVLRDLGADDLHALGAELLEIPEKHGAAARYFEQALEKSPDHRAAYEALRSLIPVDEQPERLERLLAARIAFLAPSAERAEAQLEHARLLADVLDEPESAGAAYEATLALEEAEPAQWNAAYRALLAMRPRREDLERLSKRLDTLLVDVGSNRARAGLLALRGDLRRTRLGDRDGARSDFEAALESDESNALARLGLGLLAADAGDLEVAVDHLARALVGAAREGGALLASEERVAFQRLTRGLEQRGEGERLVEITREVLALRPASRPALEAAHLALSRRGELDQLAALYDAALAGSEAAREDPELWRRKAEIHARVEDGKPAARAAIREAVKLRPHDPTVLRPAFELARDAEDWAVAARHARTLLASLWRALGAEPAPPDATAQANRAVQIATELVDILEQKRRQPDEALSLLREIVDGPRRVAGADGQEAPVRRPTNRALLVRFADLARAQAEWGALEVALRALVSHADLRGALDDAGLALHVELAEVIGLKLERPRDAVEHLDGLAARYEAAGAEVPSDVSHLRDVLDALG